MKAIKMCQKVKEELNDKTIIEGYVHSVFNRACNIITEEDNLISVLSRDRPIYPFSIVIKGQENFLELGINHGTEVVINNKRILFKDLNLAIDLTEARIWSGRSSAKETPVSEDDIVEKLGFIEDYLCNFGNSEGVAPLIFNLGSYIEEFKPFKELDLKMNFYCLFILEKFVNFINSVKKGDMREISESAKQIIGFGPGLTPSTDDLICGFMLTLIYLSNYYGLKVEKAMKINRSIIDDIGDRTTKVSHKMLEFASQGESSEDINTLLNAIFYEPINESFNKRVVNVLSLGETSGTDLLCGIYFCCKIMMNIDNRRIL
ncbi:DUF2877 domain-containing protein [Maledivibacter halophilus]|uniref:DUF2877 domain-containing protein n=1 Tax=Maledivibacter halophilus TaxID=36842 RepID=A0A1T5IU38_9FIRM|nr:DUF2877 domain-containing protein [Maledivibacter halophilus]SKC42508.1 Protein of unknown function [Maledivibacter halophilus]